MLSQRSLDLGVPGKGDDDHPTTPGAGPPSAYSSLEQTSAAFAAVVMFACFAMAIAALALVEGRAAQSKLNPLTSARGAVAAEVNLPGPKAPVTQTAPNATLPVNIVLPSIGVRSKLSDLRLQSDGSLEAPKDFSIAGWWSEGTRPGDPGPAVVVGHVDSFRGPAVFHKLGLLKLDSQILIGQGREYRGVRSDGCWAISQGQISNPSRVRLDSGTQSEADHLWRDLNRRKRSYQDNVVIFARQVSTAVTLSADAVN